MRTALALACLVLAAPAAASPTGDLAKLAWMAGTWGETKGQVTTRETWQAPVKGVMSGATETTKAGGNPSAESMKITAEPAGITFTAMPAGQPPTPFVLLAGSPGEVCSRTRPTTSRSASSTGDAVRTCAPGSRG